MDRNITDQEKEKIINFGAFKYTPENMAIILEWPLKEIKSYLENEKSEFYTLYRKGDAVAEYLLNVKIFEMAKAGDLKALDKYNAVRRSNDMLNKTKK